MLKFSGRLTSLPSLLVGRVLWLSILSAPSPQLLSGATILSHVCRAKVCYAPVTKEISNTLLARFDSRGTLIDVVECTGILKEERL